MKIVLRSEARRLGLKRYFTGKPCKRGHIAERYMYGKCITCAHAESSSKEKKEYDRAYYKKNKQRIAEYGLSYREKNKDRILKNVARWQAQNPEKVTEIKQAYKHRRRAQEGGGASWRDVMHWKKAQKKVCYWCGGRCQKDYHVDHYEPLSKGGKHELDNLVISCPSCNRYKSAKDPYKFANDLGRLF